ncbi:MAG: signal peptidase II, partial [Chloroflexia bacterium]
DWVVTNIAAREPQVIIEGFARLRYTENTGAAFGLFQGWTGLLSILAGVVVVAIIVSAQRVGNGTRTSMLALGLVTGGAIGNLVDRVRLGYVVDFIEVYWARMNLNNTVYTFPVFNVADSAISIGVVLLLLTLFLHKDERVVTSVDVPTSPSHKSTPWFTRPEGPASRHTEEPKVGES